MAIHHESIDGGGENAHWQIDEHITTAAAHIANTALHNSSASVSLSWDADFEDNSTTPGTTCHKVNGVVHLHLHAARKTSTIVGSEAVATLPTGSRPTQTIVLMALSDRGATLWSRVQIATTGVITVESVGGTYVFADTSFVAA